MIAGAGRSRRRLPPLALSASGRHARRVPSDEGGRVAEKSRTASTHPRFDLEGQVALVTGANRGLGRAIALALADAGADVALGLRDASTGGALTSDIEA